MKRVNETQIEMQIQSTFESGLKESSRCPFVLPFVLQYFPIGFRSFSSVDVI